MIERVVDGYRLPGLVDAHVHIESSHLAPREFGRQLVAHGTFAAVCDPHEIVNVAGEAGLKFMLEDARAASAQLFFALPSCVPATVFETSGATIDAATTERLFDEYPEMVALAEMMNYPGVLANDPEVLGKIQAALKRGKRVDGHFPGGRGEALRRYAAAGITSDHEMLFAADAREVASNGMMVLIREGSSAKNLAEIIKAVDDTNWRQFCFCTDDMSAADLARGGGILDCVRKAVRMGMDPERAVAIASENAIRHYGLKVDPEAYFVVRDLVDFEIVRVVPPRREMSPTVVTSDAALRGSVHLPDLEKLAIPPRGAGQLAIGVTAGSLVTERVELASGEPCAQLVVIERHGVNGNIAYAPIVGVGEIHGAIASTIGHDSHNLVVMGDNVGDLRAAAAHLGAIGGGAVVVQGGRVLAEMRLPLGGLMSDEGVDAVAAADRGVREAAHAIGCTLPEPLTTLAFMSLPVIPHLKLTDRGLFDVDAWRFA